MTNSARIGSAFDVRRDIYAAVRSRIVVYLMSTASAAAASIKSRWALAASVALNVRLLGALALGGTRGSGAYQVVVAPDLQTRRTPVQIAQLALGRMNSMADELVSEGLGPPKSTRILSISATTRDDVGAVEPGLAGTLDPGGPIWVVRAEGSFISRRGKGAPIVARSGYLIFDDATGEPLGVGMP